MKKGIKRLKIKKTSKSSNSSSNRTIVKRPTSSYKDSLKNYSSNPRSASEKKMNLIVNGAICLIMLIIMIVFYLIFGILAAGLLFAGAFIIFAVHLILSNKNRSRKKRRIINGIFILQPMMATWIIIRST